MAVNVLVVNCPLPLHIVKKYIIDFILSLLSNVSYALNIVSKNFYAFYIHCSNVLD